MNYNKAKYFIKFSPSQEYETYQYSDSKISFYVPKWWIHNFCNKYQIEVKSVLEDLLKYAHQLKLENQQIQEAIAKNR